MTDTKPVQEDPKAESPEEEVPPLEEGEEIELLESRIEDLLSMYKASYEKAQQNLQGKESPSKTPIVSLVD